ncbi:TonB-dependent receptor plug domain-containing protein [Tsuneonella sp. YG55]|uniref:TonB-dependent receptor plug domain-containing protein n=1 Tax=Tsuneonella litorea TaxID=2976475 RepID=A0A9X2W156_9SPHN|nr:TonB-dependent receptor plug domain-containing protein [Tsuneonella litorea]MCT2558891.1 TonB-dependent receptor plug domain-containing protein [Tsuneonella litorea]
MSHSPAVARFVAILLAGAAAPAIAEDVPVADAPPPPQTVAPAAVDGRESYTAADFARYSPKSALDMLRNVPGFQIKAEREPGRGLGQANTNVLVNGQRLASKSDSLFDQLARIPATSVVRIDIVDGASLTIPGLSGQVADIVTRSGGLSGQYNWRGEVRPHFSHPGFLSGDISLKGSTGALEYTVALANEEGRGAFGGEYRILNGDGTLREVRDGRFWSDYDAPKASANLTWNRGGDIGHLSGSYRREYSTFNENEDRFPVAGVPRNRDLYGRERGYDYEIGGDYAFDLGGGRLKLIGLDRYRRGRYSEDAVLAVADGSPQVGGRYAQVSESGEVIGRAEFGWKWGKADWQIAAEAAFNRYDKDASLFDLAPSGAFVEVPFPGGDGGVREDRYEAVLSYGRPITGKLTMQLSAGAENSTISQSGANTLSRTFTRPKGSLNLGWAPQKGLDISLNIERTVGQLDFGDFLARAFLDQGNQNSNNAELVPTQSWNFIAAIKKDLGKWGSTNLRLFDRRLEDFITIIPLPDGGEGRGNVARAHRYGFEWTSTVNLDPIGFKGAKIDGNLILQTSAIRDPLTGETRQISNLTQRHIEVDLRHDVPGTDWAWGAGFQNTKRAPYYRVFEVGRDSEGPVFDSYFIEHKDVLGMTVRLQAINFANARHRLYRTVYAGPRNLAPVAFVEDRAQLIGPLFRLSVKGTF